MSAVFSIEDKEWLVNGFDLENNNTFLLECFEHQTTYDVAVIEKKMKKEKFLRKVCLYKNLLFPLEYVLTFVLFGKSQARDKALINRLYRQFYKKKITLEVFEKQLKSSMSDMKLI